MSGPVFTYDEGVRKLLLPVSAFELFDIVKDVLREDARCFNSSEWISPPGHSLAATQLPACGTVACIAGWMVILTRGSLKIAALVRSPLGRVDFNAGDVACEILGMTWDEVNGLFEAGPLKEANDTAISIARIEKFQQLHEERLLNRWVSPDAAQWVIERDTF